jgi:hypothetical protein
MVKNAGPKISGVCMTQSSVTKDNTITFLAIASQVYFFRSFKIEFLIYKEAFFEAGKEKDPNVD